MNQYQVGGSLKVKADSYVVRQADTQLYEALLRDEFCYVFNCRQMGKSSLRVRIKSRLEEAGYACASLDMTNIGSNSISALQWYKSIASELWRGFNLIGKVKFKSWWSEQTGLSPIQQLDRFISDVILPNIEADKIFIFIDEIDSVISLDFSTDDFFALIRYFYNQRAEKPQFSRLSFALFGVATPSSLIADPARTPFNIGKAIELTGFTFLEAKPLIAGLQNDFQNPELILQEILNWTGGQPFLTQKLCKLCVEYSQVGDCPRSGHEAEWIKDLVDSKIIENWESQDEPEHLRTIRDRLLRDEQKANRLLRLAAEIFRYGFIPADDSPEQRDILLSNLVIKKSGQLIHRNLIYQRIFNLDWLEQQQQKLRPFSKELEYWLASKCQDKSRLLRGDTLRQAQAWASNHNMSQEEYQFLTASQVQEQDELRQKLELEKLREVEAKLIAQQQSAKKQRLLNITLGTALAISTLLGIVAYQQFRRAIAGERRSNLNEIEARVNSADALFASEQRLDALIEAIQAKRKLDKIEIKQDDSAIANSVDDSLLRAVQGANEYNRLLGHTSEVWGAVYSPDGETIASASSDGTVRLWSKQGKQLNILKGHTGAVRSIAFSSDNQTIASGGDDGTVRLWDKQGKELNILQGHQATIRYLTFSPDGETIASGGDDGTVRLWDKQGKNILTIAAHPVSVRSVAFSANGEIIASSSEDNSIKLWNIKGKKLRTLTGHTAAVLSVEFSPQNDLIVSGGEDNTIRIWNSQGRELNKIEGHDAPIRAIAFSPDGTMFASASADNSVKIWNNKGQELHTLLGHTATVRNVAFSPDNKTVISASSDLSIKLWRINNPNLTVLNHNSAVRNVAFSPNNDIVATASSDNIAVLWSLDGQKLQTLKGHTAKLSSIAFNSDRTIATASFDNTVKLWNDKGKEIQTITHAAAVRSVAFNPIKPELATASTDNTVRIWDYAGNNLQTFKGQQAGEWAVTYSTDGKLLAAASEDGTIKLWNFNTQKLDVFMGHQAAVLGIEFSPNGKYIASASRDNTVKLWNLQGENIATFKGHQTLVRDVAFSPDGKYIASASGDKTVKLWNLQGEELSSFKGHSAAIRGIAFSADGKYVASASEDGTAILWNVKQMLKLKPLSYACNWAKDYINNSVEVEKNICQ